MANELALWPRFHHRLIGHVPVSSLSKYFFKKWYGTSENSKGGIIEKEDSPTTTILSQPFGPKAQIVVVLDFLRVSPLSLARASDNRKRLAFKSQASVRRHSNMTTTYRNARKERSKVFDGYDGSFVLGNSFIVKAAVKHAGFESMEEQYLKRNIPIVFCHRLFTQTDGNRVLFVRYLRPYTVTILGPKRQELWQSKQDQHNLVNETTKLQEYPAYLDELNFLLLLKERNAWDISTAFFPDTNQMVRNPWQDRVCHCRNQVSRYKPSYKPTSEVWEAGTPWRVMRIVTSRAMSSENKPLQFTAILQLWFPLAVDAMFNKCWKIQDSR